jgi:hypothetical protein
LRRVQSYFDNLFVRKYVSSEPSYTSWGDEEKCISFSMIDMNDVSETWAWSNFTWSNSTVVSGVIVGWRI